MKVKILNFAQESTVQVKSQEVGFSPRVLSATGRRSICRRTMVIHDCIFIKRKIQVAALESCGLGVFFLPFKCGTTLME